MPIAFYFLKIRGDGEAALEKINGLRGAYEVGYATLVFGGYDMIVRVSGAHPQDIIKFWFDVGREVEGAYVVGKCFSPQLSRREE